MDRNNEAEARGLGKIIVSMVDRRIKEALRTANFDRTTWGIITNGDGKGNYSVNIQRTVYTGMRTLRGNKKNLKVGDTVIVCIPNNIMSNAYILGTLKEDEE